jgi:putative sigma-54 modulation protein
MQVEFTGRQCEISESLKTFTHERLEKTKKYLEHIDRVNVILSVEKYRQIAEIIVQNKWITLNGVEETSDMYSSINLVLDKIEKQAKRQKNKLIEKKRRAKTGIAPKEMMEYDEAEVSERDVKPQIIKSTSFSLKPMEIEEAVMQIDSTHHEFLVFRNSQTERINVIYKRKDGHYGLIEPEG